LTIGLNNVLSGDKCVIFRCNDKFLNFDAIWKILTFGRGIKNKVQTDKFLSQTFEALYLHLFAFSTNGCFRGLACAIGNQIPVRLAMNGLPEFLTRNYFTTLYFDLPIQIALMHFQEKDRFRSTKKVRNITRKHHKLMGEMGEQPNTITPFWKS